MKRPPKEQLVVVARDWYKPSKRGERARQLLLEHPEYFQGV